jgi:osmotically-inducible protein OsmY
MPQDQRYGRRYSHYDRDDERDYGRGRDEWRGESRSYRSSRYEDEGGRSGHDQRQDRDYQGTLRAGDYGRYEEEEGRHYPERFSRRRSGSEYGSQDFGGSYGGGSYGGGSYGGYRGEDYGGSTEGGYRSGSYGGGYGQESSGIGRSRDYGSSGASGYRSSGGGYGDYGSGRASQSGGFGTYTQDYDRKYGGAWTGGGRSSDAGYGRRDQRAYGNRDRDWWDRATDEVSSWFGDEDAERRRRLDQHRGRGPKNYSRSDERIREDVSDRLTDDPLVDASEIDVSVSEQEVTLSGTVHTRQQRRLAEDCAESVSGVKHVQNNLRVKQPSWSSGQSGSSTTGQNSFGSGGTTTM